MWILTDILSDGVMRAWAVDVFRVKIPVPANNSRHISDEILKDRGEILIVRLRKEIGFGL